MQKTIEEISPTKKRFTVEIPAEVLENKITDALRNLGRTAKIPGFRPGKTPLSLLEKRFGKNIETEVLEKIIPEYYLKSIKEEEVVPVTPPVFENYDFKRKSSLKMTFTVEIQPEIEDIRYEGLRVKNENVDVTDDEVENALQRLQLDKSSYEKIDNEISNEDLVVVDYEIVEEEQEVKNQFIKVGSDIIPEEISNSLRGKKAGDTFEVIASFPEDYINKNMSGKTLTLKGTVNEVKQLKKAELNDSFAKDLEYENMEKLKEAMRESIFKAKEGIIENKQKGELIEQIVKEHDFSLPQGLLEAEINMLTEEKKRQNPEAEVEKIKEDVRDDAIRHVKLNILLDIIAEREGIDISDDEIKKKIVELSNNMYMTPEKFIQLYLPNENAYYTFKQNNIRQKALDFIFSKAVKEVERGEEKPSEKSAIKSEVEGDVK